MSNEDHHRAIDQAIHERMRRADLSQGRRRSASTNTPPRSRRFTSMTAEMYHHEPLLHYDVGLSPGRPHRQSMNTTVLPSRRASAIYQATHLHEEQEGEQQQGHGSDVFDVHNASFRRAARELLGVNNMRSRQLIVDLHRYQSSTESSATLEQDPYEVDDDDDDDDEDSKEEGDYYYEGNVSAGDEEVGASLDPDFQSSGRASVNPAVAATAGESTPLMHRPESILRGTKRHRASSNNNNNNNSLFSTLIQQSTAVAVVGLLNIMVAIPFGASYFPIGWRAADVAANDVASTGSTTGTDADDVSGLFPLPGKQALGIRMFLFATIMGQLAFTFASKFENPIGLQMVENVPFLHALCQTVIRNQGYGREALSTVFFLFAISSVIVGITFYLLGKWKLGRIVYFFPNHVLVGCIGGIGVFIVVTAIEVTSDVTFTFDMEGLRGLVEHFNLMSVVLGFEIVLRFLQYMTQDKHGNSKYPLLSPVYYCLITPLFYLGLHLFGVSIDEASELGYFFPPIVTDADDVNLNIWQDPHMWDIFKVFDFSSISFSAVFQSTGTMIALAAFSLIHVPINIPAFAISTDVDTDMNAELIAHGYANALSGICGGLQTYMTYSNSVLYAKSGGRGKISSLAIVALTGVLFVIGPSIASYLPRCMAGTLLLHIGIDLVLEGVYDSFRNYDHLEYFGIWAIALVMTIWGMTAALVAGVIAALTTYAVQSINYQNPIRQILTASTLRSSAWTRCVKSRAILENDTTGRSRILIFQLQGHLFFGNVAQLTDTIQSVLKEKKDFEQSPIVVIVDFTLVVGMDSSAAHAVAKLKKIIHRLFHVEVSIFVTGSGRGGFPCEFALSEALSPEAATQVAAAGLDYNQLAQAPAKNEADKASSSPQIHSGSVSFSRGSHSVRATKKLAPKADGRVCESLDDALRFAEDILIAREDPTLEFSTDFNDLEDYATINMTLEEEKFHSKKFLRELLPKSNSKDMEKNIDILLGVMKREEVSQEETLWESGAESDSMKLLVCGELVSVIEDTGASEVVQRGNVVGELGLVHGTKRLTTVVCSSEMAVLYSLSKTEFDRMRKKKPQVAAAIDGVVIRYLAHRVQHVNNRYFHTTLPV